MEWNSLLKYYEFKLEILMNYFVNADLGSLWFTLNVFSLEKEFQKEGVDIEQKQFLSIINSSISSNNFFIVPLF